MAANHGKPQRYRDGCRCDECRAAIREYQADLRRRKAAGEPVAGSGNVVSFASRPANTAPAVPGRVEAAVEAEIEHLQQTVDRPGLAAMALTLAQLMDDPTQKGKWPDASAKLDGLLDKLRKGADSKKSKLASVRAMTSGRPEHFKTG